MKYNMMVLKERNNTMVILRRCFEKQKSEYVKVIPLWDLKMKDILKI